MTKPLSIRFNAAVMTMANKVCPDGYDVGDEFGYWVGPPDQMGYCTYPKVPDSLAELQDHVARTGRILVDGRHSDHTIFGCPEHNWAFRAWHDWTHLTIHAEFTLDGELAVAHRQIEDLCRVYGHNEDTRLWSRYIMAEVYGQACYHHTTGEFPADQVAFDLAYVR